MAHACAATHSIRRAYPMFEGTRPPSQVITPYIYFLERIREVPAALLPCTPPQVRRRHVRCGTTLRGMSGDPASPETLYTYTWIFSPTVEVSYGENRHCSESSYTE